MSPTDSRLLASVCDGPSEGKLSGVLARILTSVKQEARDSEMQVVLRQVRADLLPKRVRQRVSKLDYVSMLVGKDDPKSPHWDAVADLLTNWQFLEAKTEADPNAEFGMPSAEASEGQQAKTDE